VAVSGGFRGIDPAGLGSLAGALDGIAAAVDRAAAESSAILSARDRYRTADQTGTALSRLARWATHDAAELRHRARLISTAQAVTATSAGLGTVGPVLVADAEFALVASFGLPDWGAARSAWLRGPAIEALDGLPPAGIATAFAEMSTQAVHRLVLEAPERIGRLDGVPAPIRYAANDIVITRTIADLAARAAELEDVIRDFPDEDLWRYDHDAAAMEREMAVFELERVEARLAAFTAWRDEDRRLLLFEPPGDGRVVEVFGDLDTAEHVAVVVPGITNDIDNFGPVEGSGFRANAAALHEAASGLEPSVATVAWLGYDTPDGVDAVVRTAARAGHDDLVRFVSGLVADEDVHVTVIGHSYGSLVTGMAAGRGMLADEVVFVGSPGTSLDHASEARLAVDGEVWAGLAAWDPIGAGIDLAPHDTWDWVLSAPARHVRDMLVSGEATVEHLWHGRNPAHGSFGAVEFSTTGARGHSEYFAPGTKSLENLAAIVADLPHLVDVIDAPPRGGAFGASGGGGAW
jgi:hypothetical protein